MTGTVMERATPSLLSGLPRSTWPLPARRAFQRHQLHRELGCAYNTAWFLHHRVMEAMRRGGLDLPRRWAAKARSWRRMKPISAIEAGGQPGRPKNQGFGHKRAIIALVERGGEVRTFHVPAAHVDNVAKIVLKNIHHETRLHTDESRLYHWVGDKFAAHETVNHSDRNMPVAT